MTEAGQSYIEAVRRLDRSIASVLQRVHDGGRIPTRTRYKLAGLAMTANVLHARRTAEIVSEGGCWLCIETAARAMHDQCEAALVDYHDRIGEPEGTTT